VVLIGCSFGRFFAITPSLFCERPSFGFQHRAPLLDAPIERNALHVDLGAIHLVVVLDAQLETDIRSRADLALATRHRAVVLREAPEHAI
jgi:hypothetical protein